VIDDERGHDHVFVLINHVFGDVMRVDSGRLLGGATPRGNVRAESCLQMTRHRCGAFRPEHQPRVGTPAGKTGQPQIRKAADVIGVKVRKENGIDVVQPHADLAQPLRGPTSAIEEQDGVPSLDQDRWTEPIDGRHQCAGAKQRHPDAVKAERRAYGQGQEKPDEQMLHV
jgi:hypothetical protein